MRRQLDIVINALTLGSEGQSFLGARWVERCLKAAPEKHKRKLALRALGWSPHYFIFMLSDEYARLSRAERAEREVERIRSTRERLCSSVLLPHLEPTQVVMDYGCGPGFLASSVSRHARMVYGIDLSRGVLECARILHSSSNVVFLHTSQLNEVADGSVDVVYSFAVVQHVTDSVFAEILAVMHRKLKAGGKLLVHVVLDGEKWRNEGDWRRDSSWKGRLKWRYGLNCFRRDVADVMRIVEMHGFTSIVIRPMEELCPEAFDEVCMQHLVCAVRA